MQIIEGTVIEKETGLSAMFEGHEHRYVRAVVSIAGDEERQAECRILDRDDLPGGDHPRVRLEVTRVTTDRKHGVVRFDCHLL